MTNSRSTALTALRWLARALALAAACFVVAEIGLRYATIGPSISPVWPPTGLAVAALVLLGPGYWPAILLGAFLVARSDLVVATSPRGELFRDTLGPYCRHAHPRQPPSCR